MGVNKGTVVAACAPAPNSCGPVTTLLFLCFVADQLPLEVQMEAFNHLMLEYPELMYSGVGATAFVAGGALIYKIVTR